MTNTCIKSFHQILNYHLLIVNKLNNLLTIYKRLSNDIPLYITNSVFNSKIMYSLIKINV
jgi:hypothetical protein